MLVTPGVVLALDDHLQVHQLCQTCVAYGEHLLTEALKSNTPGPAAEKLLLRSTDWLRKGLKLLERTEQGSLPQFAELQARALRRLARSFFELGSNEACATKSDALASAEAALGELITFYRQRSSTASQDANILLLRIDILHKRDAPLRTLLEAVRDLVTSKDLEASAIDRVLAIIRARGAQLEFVREAVKLLLQRLVQDADSPNPPDTVTRVVLTLALVSKSAASVPVLRDTLDLLEQLDFHISRDGGLAIQMLCWRHGEGLQGRSAEPDHLLAASFYEIAMHPMFKTLDKNVARTARKVALCYLEAGRPEAAQQALHACPPHLADDALNHYINFDIAVRMRREDDAFAALQALLGAPNFRSVMLPTVVQVAQEARFERVVYHAMRSISEQAQVDASIGREVDAVVLTRSLVKHSLPRDGLSYDQATAEIVIEHLENNLSALKKRAELDPTDARACKEAEWSYRTAFNSALLMCDVVDSLTAAKAFDLALALAQCRESLTAQPADKQIHSTKLWSCLPSLVARSAVARRGDLDEREARTLWAQCHTSAAETWTLLQSARGVAASEDAESSAEWTLMVLEYEAFARLDDWTGAAKALQTALDNKRAPVKVVETMADIAWGSKSCTPKHLQDVLTVSGPHDNVDAAGNLTSKLDVLDVSLRLLSRR
jgi:tetratricopeptide (TPR) repeat protein